MAKMTRMQIDHLRCKLSKKINELCSKRKELLDNKLPAIISCNLNEEMSQENFVIWMKKQSKAFIVKALSAEGSLPGRVSSCTGCSVDVMHYMDKRPNSYPQYREFLEKTGVMKKLRAEALRDEALKKQRSENNEQLFAYRVLLDKEADEVIDAAVFAETPADVQKAIAAFMAKK